MIPSRVCMCVCVFLCGVCVCVCRSHPTASAQGVGYKSLASATFTADRPAVAGG